MDGMWRPRSNLPMYKDKPYAYPASQRLSLWERPRTWVIAGVSFITILLWLAGAFTTEYASSAVFSSPARGGKAITPAKTWDSRRDAVRDTFIKSWDGYKQYAWGKDEYHPVSKSGKQMTPLGMGWIIVDALDTLMIMNLTSRLAEAREWVGTTLNYNQDQQVNTFETTIRMLGGLLAAHYLSTEFPMLAPLEEDDLGKPGEDLYLEKAADLADRIAGAFDSDSGVPYASVNLKTRKGVPSHMDGGASSTAEATTLQLEFKYLALIMGEKYYWDIAEKVMQVVDDNGAEDGLVPIYLYANNGKFRTENIRLGSRGDSYYEYLIKQYLQTNRQESVYKEMWEETLAGMHKHLTAYSAHSHFTVLGERPNGLGGQFSPKVDHLVCFMPGTIALAQTEGRSLADARKLPSWGKKQEDEILYARELMKTCWGMYKAAATGLAGEITHFELGEPAHFETDGRLASKDVDWHATNGEAAAWKSDFNIKPNDAHNLQRPESIESLFYMWRITGDSIYREWGWEMFEAFLKWTPAHDDDGSESGFTSLGDANTIPPSKRDNMESFWLAETLKYFYLLFSDNDLLPLDKLVFNTEAHPLPVFKLQKQLKTGWTRKPRDKDGKLIPEENPTTTAPHEPRHEADDRVKHVTQTKVVHVVSTAVAGS